MSKIICDVCGTRYPDTAEQCPICGRIRDTAGRTAEDVLIMDDAREESYQKVRGGRFSKSNVKKRTEGGVSYEQMLRNARVHDRDGDLTDRENSVSRNMF